MSEMRHDWLTDRWVIFAPQRAVRPDDYVRGPSLDLPSSHTPCPFCAGSEHETPDPTLILPQLDCDATTSTRQEDLRQRPRSPWRVRVVPNKFPAVCLSPVPVHVLQLAHAMAGGQEGCAPEPLELSRRTEFDLFVRRKTHGAHEVIIESPEHVSSLTHLSQEHAALVFEAYQKRLIHWRARASLKYAVIFKNYGVDAGASLVHSHSQLIGTDFVPSDVDRWQGRLVSYYHSKERCYFCDVLEREQEHAERIVCESDHFIAICPFASRFPYAVQILPKCHQSTYEECSADEVRDLSSIMQRVLRAIEDAHPAGSYNFILHTAPFETIHSSSYHWRIKIIPRLCKVAGFEWSSDCFINTVTPEVAAKTLRSQLDAASASSRAS